MFINMPKWIGNGRGAFMVLTVFNEEHGNCVHLVVVDQRTGNIGDVTLNTASAAELHEALGAYLNGHD